MKQSGIWSPAFRAILIALIFSRLTLSGLAADLSWTGAVSQDWTNAANWSPNQVPSPDDNVIISYGSVSVDTNATFATLTMRGNAILGTMDIRGTLHWVNGEISGPLWIRSNAVLNISNVTGVMPYLRTNTFVVNEGTVNISPSYFRWGANTIWSNMPGSIFRLNTTIPYVEQGAVLDNSGTLLVTNDWVTFHPYLINRGLVDIAAWQCLRLYGARNSGTFHVGGNAFVMLNSETYCYNGLSSGPYSFEPGHNVTGPGFFGVIENGSEPVHIEGPIRGVFQWNGGTIAGPLWIGADGVLKLIGSMNAWSSILNSNSTVLNEGTVEILPNSYFKWGPNVQWTNAPGSLFDMKCALRSVGAGAVFYNYGTLKGEDPYGGTLFEPYLYNYGQVDVTEMLILFGGRSSGSFNIARNAWVILGSGTYSFDPGHNVTGEGFFGVSDFRNPVVRIDGPIRSTFQWNGGTITGSLWIGSDGVLKVTRNMSPVPTAILNSNATVLNEGIVEILPQSSFQWGANVMWTNAPGSLFNMQNSLSSLGAGSVLYNNGTMFGSIIFPAQFVQGPSGEISLYKDVSVNTIFVCANASLDGTLRIILTNDYVPAPDTRFQVIACSSHAGDFCSYAGLGIQSGLRFEPEWSGNDLYLRAVAVTNRLTQFVGTNGQMRLRFDGDAERTLQVFASTNLLDWLPILTTNSPNGILEFDDPNAALFPRRFYRTGAQ